MNQGISDLIDKIAELPSDWHKAGMMSPEVLRAIARHSEQIGPINQSAETGSGLTTLLFSHLSASHLVFAIDLERSIRQAKESPLLNPAGRHLRRRPYASDPSKLQVQSQTSDCTH